MDSKLNIENILKKGFFYLIPLFFLLFTFGSDFFKFFILIFFFPLLIFLFVYFKKASPLKNLHIRTYEKILGLFLLLIFFSSTLAQNKFSAFFGDYNNHLFSFIAICVSIFFFLYISRSEEFFSEKNNFLKVFLYSSTLLFIYKIVSSFQPALNFFKFSTEDLLIVSSLNILLFTPLLFSDFFSKKQAGFVKYFLLLLLFLSSVVFYKPLFIALIFALFLQLSLVQKEVLYSSFKRKSSLLVVLVFFFGVILSIGSDNIYKIGEGNLDRASSIKLVTSSLKTNFLFGVGMGSYPDYLSLHRPLELNYKNNWQIRFSNSSSFFFNLPITVGFFASLSFLFFIVLLLTLAFRLFKNYKKESVNYLFISGLGVFVFVLFLPFLTTFSYLTFVLFWFFLAFFLSINQKNSQLEKKNILIANPANMFRVAYFLLIFSWLLIVVFSAKFLIADIYSKTNTEKSILKAIYFNPNIEEYHITLSKIYLEKAKLELNKVNKDYGAIARDIDEAKKWAEKAIAINPNSVVAYETLGIIYRDIANYSSNGEIFAIGPLLKAFSLEPSNPVLATEIGKLYLLQNDKVDCGPADESMGCNENALKYFNIAHSLKNDYSDASLGLARVMIANNNNREAIDLLENIADINFNNSRVYFELGRAYFNMNNDSSAIENFQRSLLFDPNNSNSLYSLALTYDRMGDKESAFLYYKKTQDLNPGNIELMQKVQEFK